MKEGDNEKVKEHGGNMENIQGGGEKKKDEAGAMETVK